MNQMYQPYQFQPSQRLQFPAYQQPVENLHWVENQAQAEAYMVGIGSKVALWDISQNRIYVKATDDQGVPQQMRILKYEDITSDGPVKEETPKYVTADQIEELVSKAIDKHYEKRREARKKGEANE